MPPRGRKGKPKRPMYWINLDEVLTLFVPLTGVVPRAEIEWFRAAFAQELGQFPEFLRSRAGVRVGGWCPGCREGQARRTIRLWGVALPLLGGSFGVAMTGFCRWVPAKCPACGGAACWQSQDTVGYRCQVSGQWHDTGIGWCEVP